jgi:hypothetical protein
MGDWCDTTGPGLQVPPVQKNDIGGTGSSTTLFIRNLRPCRVEQAGYPRPPEPGGAGGVSLSLFPAPIVTFVESRRIVCDVEQFPRAPRAAVNGQGERW